MRARVLKYPLQMEQREMIMMPRNARILSVVVENEHPTLYALVPGGKGGEEDPEPCFIRIVTTGDEFNDHDCSFIGTVVIKGWFVAHVFEQYSVSGIGDSSSTRWADDFRQIRQELKTS